MLRQLHARLLGSRWFGRRWYQHVEVSAGGLSTAQRDPRARRRTDSFLAWIPRVVRPADRVFDIGCNAGLFSFAAGEICQSVVGVELDRHFVAQARLVEASWRQAGRPADRVRIIQGDVAAHLDLLADRTLVLASKVLYHKWLAAHLDELLRSIERSPADRVLAQGHVTQGELGTAAGMARLFAQYGFRSELLDDVPEYPIVLARRAA